MRRYWFYVKNHLFEFSSHLFVLRPPESDKTVITKMTVCPVSMDTISLDKIIGLECNLGHLLRTQKEKTSSINQPFSTNGSGFIYKKRFCENKNYTSKYTRYEKNVEDKIVHLKKIYKFTSEHFLIGLVVFVLIV